MRTPPRQRVRKIREHQGVGVLLYPVGQPLSSLPQRVGRGSGQREQGRGAGRGGARRVGLGFGLRSLLHNSVHVRSREPIRRHCRPPGHLTTVGGPRCGHLGHEEVGGDASNLIGQPSEVQITWNHTMFQSENHLD
ncbi:Uncharacterised protein [Mycobacterium tuberculosis]|nr:Uncharacterised protein [Mycobacterium tuberculosis]